MSLLNRKPSREKHK
ncbi:hypothetical protein AYI68_g3512, partial [Smittium mucronatum]